MSDEFEMMDAAMGEMGEALGRPKLELKVTASMSDKEMRCDVEWWFQSQASVEEIQEVYDRYVNGE